jgi:hypothetical protein
MSSHTGMHALGSAGRAVESVDRSVNQPVSQQAQRHVHNFRSDIGDWWCRDCGTVTDFCEQLNPGASSAKEGPQ